MIQEIIKEVGELVRRMEREYTQGTTTISKYVQFSQYENIEKINAYLNSKHISGDTDSLDREKPFLNIVTAVVNLWYRATDIDRKDIRVKSTNSKTVIPAFVATIKLQEWMRKAKFGAFLNDWGRALARYGSTPIKFVETEKDLFISVVDWGKFISDTVNFNANPKIEVLTFTEGQLRDKINDGYDKTMVEALIASSKQNRKLLDGTQQDNNNPNYIMVYELHGVLPKHWVTEKETDIGLYEQQMHVVSFVATSEDGEYDDFTLYKGLEAKDPYMITHLIKEPNREQSIGAVEHLFDAQWMQNHSAKAIKDQLDLASKMIFQTADGNFVGLNVLSNMETGDILVHSPNNPLQVVPNNSHDIGALKTLADMFYVQGQRTTSSTDAVTGNNLPSGTSYSLGAMLNTESHSLFEVMTENKGLHITDMMTERIIPHIKKNLGNKEQIAEILSDNDVEFIDSIYIPNEAIRRINKKQAEQIFNGELAQPEDLKAMQESVKAELMPHGNQRFLTPDDLDQKTWDEIFAELDSWDIEVETTGEGADKKVVLQSLSTVLQTVAGNPAILQDPNMKKVFNKILEETGSFSSLQLRSTPTPPPTQPDPQASGGNAKSVGELLNQAGNTA